MTILNPLFSRLSDSSPRSEKLLSSFYSAKKNVLLYYYTKMYMVNSEFREIVENSALTKDKYMIRGNSTKSHIILRGRYQAIIILGVEYGF